MSKKPSRGRVLPGSMLGFSVDRGTGYRAERVEGSGFIPNIPIPFSSLLTPAPYPLQIFPWTFPNVPFPLSLPPNSLNPSNLADTLYVPGILFQKAPQSLKSLAALGKRGV